MNFNIYCITCILNDKKYYGYTKETINRRWQNHIATAKRNNKYHLHKAITKYGQESFNIELIEQVDSKEGAFEREMYWIALNNTIREGYNMTRGGDGSPGRKDSEETKLKRNNSLRKCLRNGFTEEHRQKLSEAKRGKPGSKRGKTGIKGISWNKNAKKFEVRISNMYVGVFFNIEQAKDAYDEAKKDIVQTKKR